MKKLFKYFFTGFIFSLTAVILFNHYKIRNSENLTSAEGYFKHASVEHEINKVNFNFIKLNLSHTNYYYVNDSSTEINITAAISLFLMTSVIILYDFSKRKFFFAEKLLFISGFKNSTFRPPKHFS